MGSVYVDNITVLGRDAPLAREAASALRAEADHCGLPITWSCPDVVAHLDGRGRDRPQEGVPSEQSLPSLALRPGHAGSTGAGKDAR
eukprot:4957257-Pyramimonas_sp.AAC.1